MVTGKRGDRGAMDQQPPARVRVAVVGSGFSGLGAAIGLKRAGIDDYVLFERAADLGGTWRDNVLIAANGGLAEPSYPDIPGFDSFTGEVLHSAAWRPQADLAGKRVAVVGTGASAIQIVPEIQAIVRELKVYQRTPAWVLPHTDRPIGERERRLYRRFPLLQRAVRAAIYFARESLVVGMTRNRRLLRPLERIARLHLARKVQDRELRRRLRPRFSLGCKRILLSNSFYPALAAPNCELITEAASELRGHSIVGTAGTEREVDVVIFATGFHVIDNPTTQFVRGQAGVTLADHWRERNMGAYLGTTVDRFPNLFRTTGGCVSWYLDEHGRNPTLWPDFTWKFKRATRRFDTTEYVLTPATQPTRGESRRSA